MNPDDFLTLALKLANQSGEAEQRSAVSRAYYGAFHRARALVDSCGVVGPKKSAEVHAKVSQCLQECGDSESEVVGRKLDSLREARNDADYQLSDRRFESRTFALVQLKIAREIADGLSSATTRFAEIRPRIRQYARDILKLGLHGND